MLLLSTVMLLTACSTLKIGEATDSALCSELSVPIDQAVETTLTHKEKTPAPVINSWTRVVIGFDAKCK